MTSPHSLIRILYLVRDPYPTERPDVLTLFGHRLPEHGISSDIVALRRGRLAASPRPWPAGVEIAPDRAQRGPWRPLQGIVNDVFMLRRHRAYDLVVVRDKILSAVLAMMFARPASVVYWMSYPFPEQDLQTEGGPLELRRWVFRLRGAVTRALLYRVVVPRAAHVFVQSRRMLEAVAEASGRTEGMTSVPMGVDDVRLPSRICVRRGPGDGEPFRLVYLGSLDRVRRVGLLIEVLAALVRGERRIGPPGWTLTLIGGAEEPDEIGRLEQKARELGVGELVRLTGALSMDDAWVHCSGAHLGLAPIPRGVLFDVASPTKVVEYIAMGLPVVASTLPDQVDVIEATGAGECAELEVDSFEAAIRRVASNYDAYAARAAAALPWLTAERGYVAIGRRVAAVIDDLVRTNRMRA